MNALNRIREGMTAYVAEVPKYTYDDLGRTLMELVAPAVQERQIFLVPRLIAEVAPIVSPPSNSWYGRSELQPTQLQTQLMKYVTLLGPTNGIHHITVGQAYEGLMDKDTIKYQKQLDKAREKFVLDSPEARDSYKQLLLHQIETSELEMKLDLGEQRTARGSTLLFNGNTSQLISRLRPTIKSVSRTFTVSADLDELLG